MQNTETAHGYKQVVTAQGYRTWLHNTYTGMTDTNKEYNQHAGGKNYYRYENYNTDTSMYIYQAGSLTHSTLTARAGPRPQQPTKLFVVIYYP